jgi:hypothetical protein
MTDRASYPSLVALNKVIQFRCDKVNNDYFRCKGLNGENPALCIDQSLAVTSCADDWYLLSFITFSDELV